MRFATTNTGSNDAIHGFNRHHVLTPTRSSRIVVKDDSNNDVKGRTSHLRDAIDQPLSQWICVASWVVATALFFFFVSLFGGPNLGDASQSIYQTWAIAHGNLSCAYAPSAGHLFSPLFTPFAQTAPMYPIIAGGLAAAFQIGSHTPFPSIAQMGPHCSHAFLVIFHWATTSRVFNETVHLGYVGWFFVLFGTIAAVRSSGLGRRGWEPVTIILLALLWPVYLCIVEYFHPQDLVALGLTLLAIALALRGKWAWAGLMLGLAISTQQFALLALAMLVGVAPPNRRLALVGSSLLAAAIVDVPLIVLTSGRSLHASLFGSSRITLDSSGNSLSSGGTMVWEMHLHGVLLFAVSRLMPILAVLVLAIWARRKFGPRVLEPSILLPLLTTSLCFRLIFEQNLFGYYFMAVSVALFLQDLMQRRLRLQVATWLVVVNLAFSPIPLFMYLRWQHRGVDLYRGLPLLFEVVAISLFCIGAVKGTVRWHLLAASVVVALTCFPSLWGLSEGSHVVPTWDWQLLLVPTALVLAASPLRTALRQIYPTHAPIDKLDAAR